MQNCQRDRTTGPWLSHGLRRGGLEVLQLGTGICTYSSYGRVDGAVAPCRPRCAGAPLCKRGGWRNNNARGRAQQRERGVSRKLGTGKGLLGTAGMQTG